MVPFSVGIITNRVSDPVETTVFMRLAKLENEFENYTSVCISTLPPGVVVVAVPTSVPSL